MKTSPTDQETQLKESIFKVIHRHRFDADEFNAIRENVLLLFMRGITTEFIAGMPAEDRGMMGHYIETVTNLLKDLRDVYVEHEKVRHENANLKVAM